MQHVELIARFEYDQFASPRNTKQTAIRPNRGTEIIAANSFLIANLAGRRIQTRHNPRVAPEPDQAVLEDAGGDVGSGFFDLVSQFGFAVCGCVSRFYGGDDIGAEAAAAGAQDEVACDQRRAD